MTAAACVEIMIAQKKSMVNSKVESEGGVSPACVVCVAWKSGLLWTRTTAPFVTEPRAAKSGERAPSQSAVCEHSQ
jgi:hypothetical protein